MQIIRAILIGAVILIVTSILTTNGSAVSVGLWPLPYTVTLSLGAAILASFLLGGFFVWLWRLFRR